MDQIMSLLKDFDPSAFLPKLNTVLGWVELIVRIAVMAGPLILLFFGLLSFLAPPKEANHKMGFRALWGMGSVEAWQFTQRLAGICWCVMGIVLTVVMAVICNGFRGMEMMAMVGVAAKCLLWELILVAVVYLGINITTIILFDWDGYRRSEIIDEDEYFDEEEEIR